METRSLAERAGRAGIEDVAVGPEDRNFVTAECGTLVSFVVEYDDELGLSAVEGDGDSGAVLVEVLDDPETRLVSNTR
jgi:hypothetical protein